jgi:Cytochrome P460
MGFAVWAITSRLGSHASLAFARAEQQSREPRYDSNGALVRPKDFETWVFVGSSTGLTYEPGMQQKGAGEFHDVYIRPESYREYGRTGKFPEKTVLVLALYPPEDKVSPAKGGHFEGDLEGMAAAVKDHEHFHEGWAYFNFGEGPPLKEKARASPKQMCFTCHQQHAADDNVFVQFYPILRPVMKAHGPTSQH